MALPKPDAYTEAFQNPSIVLKDTELKQCSVQSNMLGLPKPISGGFALTFTLESRSGKKFAVRCFHKEANALTQRYKEITKRLKEIKSSYFVEFEYQEQGITIQRSKYPLVKMEWASGEILGNFVQNNIRNPSKLENLRHSIQQLANYLRSVNIAHGDIQPGNLMISNEGKRVQLIDYDGMFVESLRPLGSTEVGYANFQHPERLKFAPWNEYLDNFSFIVIDLALQTLKQCPELWDKTNSDSDKFIFHANDYFDPDRATIFKSLETIPTLKKYVEYFRKICKQPFSSIPSLSEFLALATPSIAVSSVSLRSSVQYQEKRYISSIPVLDANDHTSDAVSYKRFEKYVGDKVELIGHIAGIVTRTDRNYRPYMFFNFDDINWRNQSFKLIAWSDAISDIGEARLNELNGKWISIIGTIDQPYHNYTLSITITKTSMPHIITEEEAKFRLNKQIQPQASKNISSEGIIKSTTNGIDISRSIGRNTKNTKILEEMFKLNTSGKSSQSTTLPSTRTSTKLPSQTTNSTTSNSSLTNKNILDQLTNGTQSSNVTSYITTSSSTPSGSPQTTSLTKFFLWCFLGGILLIWLFS